MYQNCFLTFGHVPHGALGKRRLLVTSQRCLSIRAPKVHDFLEGALGKAGLVSAKR